MKSKNSTCFLSSLCLAPTEIKRWEMGVAEAHVTQILEKVFIFSLPNALVITALILEEEVKKLLTL